jgi:hypothetical protein
MGRNDVQRLWARKRYAAFQRRGGFVVPALADQ